MVDAGGQWRPCAQPERDIRMGQTGAGDAPGDTRAWRCGGGWARTRWGEAGLEARCFARNGAVQPRLRRYCPHRTRCLRERTSFATFLRARVWSLTAPNCPRRLRVPDASMAATLINTEYRHSVGLARQIEQMHPRSQRDIRCLE